jgi:hypothetical protein
MNGQHDNLGIRGPEIDRIRESEQYRATGLDVDALEQERVLDDSRDDGLDGLTKLSP